MTGKEVDDEAPAEEEAVAVDEIPVEGVEETSKQQTK